MSLVSQLFRLASVGQVKPVAFDEDTLIVLELDVEDPIVTSKQLPLDDACEVTPPQEDDISQACFAEERLLYER